MITIPDPIKKYFKIINEETIIIRPPLSKVLLQYILTFGFPLIFFIIECARGLVNIDPLTFVTEIFFSLVFLGYGYFIALPGLRKLIIIDLKNRIIKTAHGRHREIQYECSFDNVAFSYDHDFIQISSDSFTTFNRIYFHDKKDKAVFYALSLRGDSAEYQYMMELLEEICKSNENSNRSLRVN